MIWQLGGSIAGLAALDSLNPATFVAITLILLSSCSRPLPEAIGFVMGAFTTVFLVVLAVYIGAEAAASAVAGALTCLRRGAFTLRGPVVTRVMDRSPCAAPCSGEGNPPSTGVSQKARGPGNRLQFPPPLLPEEALGVPSAHIGHPPEGSRSARRCDGGRASAGCRPSGTVQGGGREAE